MNSDSIREINTNKDTTTYTFGGETLRLARGLKPNIAQICVETEEKSCRICLDSNTNFEFIRPCKCSGTVKYVHEDCLKTWLISLGKDLETSKCEICHTKYLMKMIIKRRCLPQKACKNNTAHCFFVPILVAVMVMLFLIVYLLGQKYFESGSSADQKAYTLALSLTCLIAALIILALVVHSVKEACYVPKLQEWRILSQNIQREEERVMVKEDLEKIEELRTLKLPAPKELRIRDRKVRISNMSKLLSPRNSELREASLRSFSPVGASASLRDPENLNDTFYRETHIRPMSSGVIKQ